MANIVVLPGDGIGPEVVNAALSVLAAVCTAADAEVTIDVHLIGGRAVKGPTAKMLQELGLPVTSAAVAARYGDLLSGYVVDQADSQGIQARLHVVPTLMTTLEDREQLARTVLGFADSLK